MYVLLSRRCEAQNGRGKWCVVDAGRLSFIQHHSGGHGSDRSIQQYGLHQVVRDELVAHTISSTVFHRCTSI